MWESPINILYKNVEESFENGIIKAVQKVDIIVDKEELVKALQYDRNQYRKGYEDALYKTHGKWIDQVGEDELLAQKCSVCGYLEYVYDRPSYCPNCGADMRGAEDEIQGKK